MMLYTLLLGVASICSAFYQLIASTKGKKIAYKPLELRLFIEDVPAKLNAVLAHKDPQQQSALLEQLSILSERNKQQNMLHKDAQRYRTKEAQENEKKVDDALSSAMTIAQAQQQDFVSARQKIEGESQRKQDEALTKLQALAKNEQDSSQILGQIKEIQQRLVHLEQKDKTVDEHIIKQIVELAKHATDTQSFEKIQELLRIILGDRAAHQKSTAPSINIKNSHDSKTKGLKSILNSFKGIKDNLRIDQESGRTT